MSHVTSLDATAFAGAAAVVRDRRDVDDRNNLEADCLQRADGGVAAKPGPRNANNDVLQAVRHGVARGVLSNNLRRVCGRFTRAAEVALAGGRPSDDSTLLIGDGNDGVVKGGEDVRDPG